MRIEPKLKNQVVKIFDSLGLDLSTGIKIYLTQVVRHNGVPFSLVTENGFLPQEEKRILNELAETKKSYSSGRRVAHKNTASMIKEILAK